MMRAITVFLLVLSQLALCQGWTCTQGPALRNALQVDAGLGQVVAIDKAGHSYILTGGSRWTRLPYANLKDISVGKAGLWGTNLARKRYYQYVDGKWLQFGGGAFVFNRVDAGGDGFITANRYGANHVYCIRGEYKGNRLTAKVYGQSRVVSTYWLSCGAFGCWSVIRRNQIQFNGLRSANCRFTSWRNIGGGSFQAVDVGSDGKVFAVNTRGQIVERTGITAARPWGSSWKVVPLCKTMRQVSYDLGTIYGVSTDNTIMKCTA